MAFGFFLLNSMRKKRTTFENRLFNQVVLKKKLEKKLEKINKIHYIRANLYTKRYKKKLDYIIDHTKISRNRGKFYIPVISKIFFAIRIKGLSGISPQIKKILKLFRLDRINTGVFLKINTSTLHMIKKIEAYVAYGYPSLKNINLLIKKKGYCKIGKRGYWRRTRLTDYNTRNCLSSIGIYNTNDIVEELFTSGPRFKEVSNFLWPFRLKSPKKGYSQTNKKVHVLEGGVFGNWENSINKLICKMG